MRKKVVSKGDRFNLLTVIQEIDRNVCKLGAGSRIFLFRCDCGGNSIASLDNVTRGNTTSCGCRSNKRPRHGHTIGGKASPSYYTWFSMKQRCFYKKHPAYESYRSRGITVCDRWLVFDNFLEDMGERPEGKTLDRVDNTRGYYKENCRWATPIEQGRNRKDTVWLLYKGEKRTIGSISDETGISKEIIRNRLRRGWTGDSIFNKKREKRLC